MAGDQAFTELLLGMGLRSFSMHPSQIVAIKERILAADTRRWASVVSRVLDADDPESECRVVGAELRVRAATPLASAGSTV